MKNQFSNYLIILFLMQISLSAFAQESRKLSLNEAIDLGLTNSKSLKLSKSKIEEAAANYKVTKNQTLPQAKVNIGFNHAYMLTNEFKLSSTSDPIIFPKNSDIYFSTASVNQTLFSGYKYRYAQESAILLSKIAELDADKQADEVKSGIINFYYTLYKIKKSQKIIHQNFQDIDEKIVETEKYVKQGLATENDVLRWKLQRSNISMNDLELSNNVKVVTYNLDLLLGLNENTQIEIDTTLSPIEELTSFQDYLNTSLSSRKELEIANYETQSADINIKSLKSPMYPTVSVGATLYSINPSANPIPKAGSSINPVTLGLTVSYDIASLYTTKAKVEHATSAQKQTIINKTIIEDDIKMEVRRSFENYVQSKEKIKLLEVAVDQASENYRIINSKYQNSVASTTDRIDAETLLFQARINLEIARADVKIAYYDLLKSTGKLK